MIDKKFGRLTVVDYSGRDKRGKTVWKCECECGNILTVPRNSLSSGNTKSCGCLPRDKAIEIHTTHGLSKHRLYKVWHSIIQRCYNPNDKSYDRYGGRGISVYSGWFSDFLLFYDWSMKNGYTLGLSIDRKDVNGNYNPDNCRWATREEQNQNTRRTIITPDDVRAIRKDPRKRVDIAKEYGVSPDVISKICLGKAWKNIED